MATEQTKQIYTEQLKVGIRQLPQTGPSKISEAFKTWAKAERDKPETTGEPIFRDLSANEVIDLYHQASNTENSTVTEARNIENSTVTEARKFLDKDGVKDMSLQITEFERRINNLEYDDKEAWDDVHHSMKEFSTLFDDLTKSQGFTSFSPLSFKKEYNDLIDSYTEDFNSNTLWDMKDLVQELYNLLTDISTGAVK